MLHVGERRVAAALIEGRSKELVVTLVETVHTHLQIVLIFIGAETYLAAAIGGGAVLGSSDGIGERAVIIRAVVVKEGRDRQQHSRVKGVHPRKVCQRVGFMFRIA